ncbi:MAG: hypothetical protein JWO59_2653 [Chloroflexi bacterium]|nr:hypothetical protein [Chloroflexota bacterium]
MPDIRPFRAWRFDTGRAGELASLIAPPYDVISPEKQRDLYKRSPYNIIRLELTAAEPGDPADNEGEIARHARARTTLKAWMDDGILKKDNEPALYLYRQAFSYGGRSYSRQSIVAAVRLSPWSSGQILPHERTLAKPRAERLALLRAVSSNVSPIWALYDDAERHVANGIQTAYDPETFSEQVAVDDEGVEHGISAITARLPVDMIRRALADQPLFISDGHHRYETALAYRDEALLESGPRDVGPRDFVMMVLTAADDPGLIVLPTHRLIRNLPASVLNELPAQLEKLFEVTTMEVPSDPAELSALIEQLLPAASDSIVDHRFVLLGVNPGQLLLLEPRDISLAGEPPTPELGELDVWLSQAMILEQALGLTAENLEQQTNLFYTRDVQEAAREVAAGTHQLALFLAPTPVSQLLAVARARAVMPQKSTYFYPKPATGLTLRVFEAP